MRRSSLDDATADRLLAGKVSPADAPAGYAGLAALVRAATGPADAGELANEASVVAASMAAMAGGDVSPIHGGSRSRLAKLLTAKVVAIGAFTLVGATAAAAATGTLPAPAQTAVSSAASHIGLSVPEPAHHSSSANSVASAHRQNGDAGGASAGSKSNTSTTADRGANDTHSDFGQCTAFLAGSSSSTSSTSTTSGKDASTAFADLIADHGGTVASTTSYCQGVVANPPQSASDAGKGKPSDAGDSGKSGNNSSSSNPSDTRPTATSVVHGDSGGHSGGGTSSDGHSTATTTRRP